MAPDRFCWLGRAAAGKQQSNPTLWRLGSPQSLLSAFVLLLALPPAFQSAVAADPDRGNVIPPALDPPKAPMLMAPVQVYHRLDILDPKLDLGIGHLRPPDEYYFWDWYREVSIPFFRSPDGSPFAWLQNGWLVDTESGDAESFSTAGMLETGYESPTFIVHERRNNGWLQVRYRPDEGEAGRAWVHPRLSTIGSERLVFENWGERLTSDRISPLYFRRKVPHVLRDQPSTSGNRLRLIPGDEHRYHIEPLEISGDWMRVNLVQPSDYCGLPEGQQAVEQNGWLKWRDNQTGPWLWYYTRGC